MGMYQQAVQLWARELENLWGEQQEELMETVGAERTKPFTDALAALNEGLRARADHVDELAAQAYEQWFYMTQVGRKSPAHRAQVPVGGHTLPPLPYAYDALEPYIDAETMRIHHDKHHQSYVDGLNRAETEMAAARQSSDYHLIKHWARETAFNGAGHYLHTLFWANMSPDGGGEPSGALADQIKQDFDSFEQMQAQFSHAADKVEGGGWAMLVWSPRAGRLEILQAEKHQNLSQQDQVPLLVLDVWEHAYYLKHQNDRKAYFDAWWHVVNWPEVARRFEQAEKLTWAPF
ncbi:superoxide dismutase [Bacillus sp. FSL W7-1360]